MIKLFRNNQPLNLIIILVVAFILRGSVFIRLKPDVLWLAAPLANDLNNFLRDHQLSDSFYKIASFVFILLNGIYLNFILIKHNFFARNSYMPALMYVVINSLYPTMLGYSSQLFASFFIIISIDKLFSMYDNENAVTKILDAGIFCGIASLFSFDALTFFPFILYSIAAIRPFSIRETLLSFFGLTLPYYLLAVVYLLKGDLDTVKNGFALREQVSQINSIAFSVEIMLPIIIALPLMIVAGFTYQSDISRNNVKTRKIQNVILFMLPFCVAAALFAKPGFEYSLPYYAIPCSIILSYWFQLEKRKGDLFKELSFTALCILIIALQIIIK